MAKLKLFETCGGCPEQYDVFRNDEKVGYLRLRHGYFYAECHGDTVYEGHPEGDGLFTSNERDFYLRMACRAILDKLDEQEDELYKIGLPQ